MSRLIRGGVWLLVLLVAAQGASAAVIATQSPIAEGLEAAAGQIRSGDPGGYDTALQAMERWCASRGWVSAFAGHAALEEIDVAFARLANTRPEDAALCCGELAAMVRAVMEDHRLSFRSFL